MIHVTNTEPIRTFLISEVRHFVESARACAGVRRIALVGSLVSDKENPHGAGSRWAQVEGASAKSKQGGRHLSRRSVGQLHWPHVSLARVPTGSSSVVRRPAL